MPNKQKKVLSPDAWDALELAVLAHGGIRSTSAYYDAQGNPGCLHAMAAFATDAQDGDDDWPDHFFNPISEELRAYPIEIDGCDSDIICDRVTYRLKLHHGTRITWQQFTREAGLVRGAR